jgi:hypothetical protein
MNEPVASAFTDGREDFPPYLDDLRFRRVTLYFTRMRSQVFAIEVMHLYFKSEDGYGFVGS